MLQAQKPPLTQHSFRYIKALLGNREQAKFCKHPMVRATLLRHLVSIRYSRFATLKSWAKEHLIPSCIEHLSKVLGRELYSRDFALATMAFDLLYVSDRISLRERDFFLVRNYLQKAQKGERLNLSWNALKSLANNFERRQTVLRQLKSLDPLPDQLLGIPPSPEKKTLLDHLADNFPEYLDHYSQSCLDYLQGKRPFPNGNPTIHCHQIMQEAPGKNWIGRQLLARYREVKISP